MSDTPNNSNIPMAVRSTCDASGMGRDQHQQTDGVIQDALGEEARMSGKNTNSGGSSQN